MDALPVLTNALCRQELWPGAWMSNDPTVQRRAIEVCDRCPERLPCRDAARARDEPLGIWGGETPSDRNPRSFRPPKRRGRHAASEERLAVVDLLCDGHPWERDLLISTAERRLSPERRGRLADRHPHLGPRDAARRAIGEVIARLAKAGRVSISGTTITPADL